MLILGHTTHRVVAAQIAATTLWLNSPQSRCSNSHYKNRFFESPPMTGFQKTDFGVPSALGAGNTKIGFIMRIADQKYFG
jgi:hypothetical protein